MLSVPLAQDDFGWHGGAGDPPRPHHARRGERFDSHGNRLLRHFVLRQDALNAGLIGRIAGLERAPTGFRQARVNNLPDKDVLNLPIANSPHFSEAAGPFSFASSPPNSPETLTTRPGAAGLAATRTSDPVTDAKPSVADAAAGWNPAAQLLSRATDLAATMAEMLTRAALEPASQSISTHSPFSPGDESAEVRWLASIGRSRSRTLPSTSSGATVINGASEVPAAPAAPARATADDAVRGAPKPARGQALMRALSKRATKVQLRLRRAADKPKQIETVVATASPSGVSPPMPSALDNPASSLASAISPLPRTGWGHASVRSPVAHTASTSGASSAVSASPLAAAPSTTDHPTTAPAAAADASPRSSPSATNMPSRLANPSTPGAPVVITSIDVVQRIRHDVRYFHFYRRALQLRSADLSVLTMSERVCFFLNVMMAMQVHAILALGRPVAFFDRCCEALPSYVIGGEALTVDDITSTIFRLPLPTSASLSRGTAGCGWTVAFGEPHLVAASVSSVQIAARQRAQAEHLASYGSVSFPESPAALSPGPDFGPAPIRDTLPYSWSILLYFAQLSGCRSWPHFRVFTPESLEEVRVARPPGRAL